MIWTFRELNILSFQVEVEKMKALAQDKLMNKLAAVRHKAEEKLAAAEARRNKHAVKIEKQAEYIRKTGHLPSSFSCCRWCFWRATNRYKCAVYLCISTS